MSKEELSTTQVNLGQGRLSEPFHHGRGVRQGSVGGPLKWVVFVHYWITWVKTKLKGKGYKMSASTGPTTIPNFLDGIIQDPVEFLASLFIDDSIWATSTAQAMQDLLDIHTYPILCIPWDKTSPYQIRTCLNQPRGNPHSPTPNPP